jgi:hypothetical protein
VGAGVAADEPAHVAQHLQRGAPAPAQAPPVFFVIMSCSLHLQRPSGQQAGRTDGVVATHNTTRSCCGVASERVPCPH